MYDDPTFRDEVLHSKEGIPLAGKQQPRTTCSWGPETLKIILTGVAVSFAASVLEVPISTHSGKEMSALTEQLPIASSTHVPYEYIEDEIDLRMGLEALNEPGSVPWEDVKNHLDLP